jgi:antitoxin FitA
MGIQITIRDVPVVVKDELAARAALQGKSMQEYLFGELERLAARPPVEKVLERIRDRKAMAGTRLSPEEILAQRDADRR